MEGGPKIVFPGYIIILWLVSVAHEVSTSRVDLLSQANRLLPYDSASSGFGVGRGRGGMDADDDLSADSGIPGHKRAAPVARFLFRLPTPHAQRPEFPRYLGPPGTHEPLRQSGPSQASLALDKEDAPARHSALDSKSAETVDAELAEAADNLQDHNLEDRSVVAQRYPFSGGSGIPSSSLNEEIMEDVRIAKEVKLLQKMMKSEAKLNRFIDSIIEDLSRSEEVDRKMEAHIISSINGGYSKEENIIPYPRMG